MVTALFFSRPSGNRVASNFSIGSNIMSAKCRESEPPKDGNKSLKDSHIYVFFVPPLLALLDLSAL